MKDEITLEKISGARVLVFGGPREKFSTAEFEALKAYMARGGCILILVGEGGEGSFNTNINFLLEECGIMINSGMVATLL